MKDIMIPPYKGPTVNTFVNIELGNDSEYQLYNLKKELGQLNNLAASEPELLEKLKQKFEEFKGNGFVKIEPLELK